MPYLSSNAKYTHTAEEVKAVLSLFVHFSHLSEKDWTEYFQKYIKAYIHPVHEWRFRPHAMTVAESVRFHMLRSELLPLFSPSGVVEELQYLYGLTCPACQSVYKDSEWQSLPFWFTCDDLIYDLFCPNLPDEFEPSIGWRHIYINNKAYGVLQDTSPLCATCCESLVGCPAHVSALRSLRNAIAKNKIPRETAMELVLSEVYVARLRYGIKEFKRKQAEDAYEKRRQKLKKREPNGANKRGIERRSF